MDCAQSSRLLVYSQVAQNEPSGEADGVTDQRNIDLTAIVERQKITLFLVRLVALSCLVTFFDGFDTSMMSFVGPDLSASLHLSKYALGKVLASAQFGMIFGGFLFGYLGDRLGRRWAIVLATVFVGFFGLSLTWAQGYSTLLALRCVQGIAMGGLLPLAWALNIEYAPRRFRATLVTVIMLGYSIGSSSAGPLTIWLTPRYGWRSLFVFGGCAALVTAVLLSFFLPESMKFLASKNKRPDLIARYARSLAPGEEIEASDRFFVSGESAERVDFRLSMLFRNDLRWITPLLWIAYFTSSIAVFFGATWTPTILGMLGYGRNTSALTASINTLGGALGGLLLMRFTDTRGAISIAALPALAVPILLTMGLSGAGGNAFLVLYFLATTLQVGAHYGVTSIAGIFYPSAYRSNGAGWATTIAKMGSALGPVLGGVALSSHLPTKSVFALLAICPFVVGLGVAFIGRLERHIAVDEKAEPETISA
jgi:MFS transporter, AAHS family, 4-hydroxybenzoate transporter